MRVSGAGKLTELSVDYVVLKYSGAAPKSHART
jgi:hypothetical protein